MADIFLSYARPDAAKAGRVAEALEAQGYAVWFDAHLPAHRAYSEVIEEQLEAAAAVVVLWSEAAVASQWVRSEANRARETQRLIQVRLDAVRLPMPFDQIQCADLVYRHDLTRAPGWAVVLDSLTDLSSRPVSRPNRGAAVANARPGVSRRTLLAGGSALGGLAAAGGGWLAYRSLHAPAPVPPEAATLMEHAKSALWQNSPEGQNQAIGILRQVTDQYPTVAEAWGRLALSYAVASHWRPAGESERLQQRAKSAASQALQIDARNAHAVVARGWAQPFMGNWRGVLADAHQAVSLAPRDGETAFLLAMPLAMTGRIRAAVAHLNPVLSAGATPGIYVWQAQILWSAGKDDALDALLDEAVKLYPTHFGVWFTRFYTLMMGGRPAAALAQAADTANLPTGIDPEEIDAVVRVAKAIETRAPPAVEATVKAWMERARRGAGHAENAAQFMATLGRLDEAFAVLDAYFFSEGFDPGEVRFDRAQGSFTPHKDRQTAFLFNPAMAQARADRRFETLVDRLRLSEFWRASGIRPDYRSA